MKENAKKVYIKRTFNFEYFTLSPTLRSSTALPTSFTTPTRSLPRRTRRRAVSTGGEPAASLEQQGSKEFDKEQSPLNNVSLGYSM